MLLLPVTELGNGTESNVVVAGRMSSCDVTVPVVAFQVVTRVATKSLRDLWFLQLNLTRFSCGSIPAAECEPTCISVNNIICLFSPLASGETVLEEGNTLKMDLARHVDGFIVVVAHTHVPQEGPVTGQATDVIAAANTAAEGALRPVRPGKKNKDVTNAIQGCYCLGL
ncbi:hypothetical protein KIW84_031920 [Lathyrus oleraceus]|uniref:Peptidase M24 domain-containing protein n=1 Tax=Pisum sativum TaxID=3888 RepID=A0A9D4XWP8_PEA|nr:hypothetical protein KIW84_031920 [Pisum sativum]